MRYFHWFVMNLTSVFEGLQIWICRSTELPSTKRSANKNLVESDKTQNDSTSTTAKDCASATQSVKKNQNDKRHRTARTEMNNGSITNIWTACERVNIEGRWYISSTIKALRTWTTCVGHTAELVQRSRVRLNLGLGRRRHRINIYTYIYVYK